MLSINYFAVLAATVASFFIGALWYMPFAFGPQSTALRGIDPSTLPQGAPPLSTLALEFARCLVAVVVLAIVISLVQPSGIVGALGLALLVWFGFQAVLLSGSVLHEGYPVGLWMIHSGDALAKILAASAILGVWR